MNYAEVERKEVLNEIKYASSDISPRPTKLLFNLETYCKSETLPLPMVAFFYVTLFLNESEANTKCLL